jgi:hypothetical protein
VDPGGKIKIWTQSIQKNTQILKTSEIDYYARLQSMGKHEFSRETAFILDHCLYFIIIIVLNQVRGFPLRVNH